LHLAFFLFTRIDPPVKPEGPITDQPLNVVLAPPQVAPAAPAAPPAPAASPAPREPQVIARKPSPTPSKTPSPITAPVTEPVPETPAPPREPVVDMMASIQANRARRAAAESALARGNPSNTGEDALTRNMRSLSGQEGVGGVFTVLRKGLRSGEFAFNGFRNEGQKRWREVIEVDAGPGGDIELAMVRRMIELIRTHYTGDFRWDSNRLGRVVVLSARPADQPGLEEFLMKEFFGSPAGRPSARAGRGPAR
ncbi:MAG TPA: hypothetical protein VFX50_17325, partial [Gemmatimonadales bacterium]|nr:hypothetical protein [Gemmatimonadales bacterium]